MVESRWWITALTHAVLLLGVLVVLLPIYLAFVASTHPVQNVIQVPMPMLPGGHFWENYSQVLGRGVPTVGNVPIAVMLFNSLVMALGIAAGKIAISVLSAFAIVYFRFPLRMAFFWLIFITLMLPVEVRIVPTFQVAADLNLLNSYTGLILPLIASATATFLFRQFFLTVPDELAEAARMDGAGPMRFFFDILLPLSRTNIAALFVILFIYGWNQYLWPLLITTDRDMTTVVISVQALVSVMEEEPQWHLLMAVAMLAMLPPVAVVLLMQRWFVKGLVEPEK